jgi:hypothetical protein
MMMMMLTILRSDVIQKIVMVRREAYRIVR